MSIGGLNYKGLIPTRDNDVLGVAFAYGHLNNNPQGNDGSSNPGYEMVFEATYQIVLTPWLSFQPDLQYVIAPVQHRYTERSRSGSSCNHLLLTPRHSLSLGFS